MFYPPHQTVRVPVPAIGVKTRRSVKAFNRFDFGRLVLTSSERGVRNFGNSSVRMPDLASPYGLKNLSRCEVDDAAYSIMGPLLSGPCSYIDDSRVGEQPFDVDFALPYFLVYIVGEITSNSSGVGLNFAYIRNLHPCGIAAVECVVPGDDLRSASCSGRVGRINAVQHYIRAFFA